MNLIKCNSPATNYGLYNVKLIFVRYEQYVERKADSDAKYRAKKARKEHEDEEWEGFGSDKDDSSDDGAIEHEEDSDSDVSDTDEAQDAKQLITTLDKNEIGKNGLSKKAALFFDQDIFKDLGDLGGLDELEEAEDDSEVDAEDEDDEGEDMLDGLEEETEEVESAGELIEDHGDTEEEDFVSEEEEEVVSEAGDDGIEIVASEKVESEWDADDEPQKDGRPGKFIRLYLHLIN